MRLSSVVKCVLQRVGLKRAKATRAEVKQYLDTLGYPVVGPASDGEGAKGNARSACRPSAKHFLDWRSFRRAKRERTGKPICNEAGARRATN